MDTAPLSITLMPCPVSQWNHPGVAPLLPPGPPPFPSLLLSFPQRAHGRSHAGTADCTQPDDACIHSPSARIPPVPSPALAPWPPPLPGPSRPLVVTGTPHFLVDLPAAQPCAWHLLYLQSQRKGSCNTGRHVQSGEQPGDETSQGRGTRGGAAAREAICPSCCLPPRQLDVLPSPANDRLATPQLSPPRQQAAPEHGLPWRPSGTSIAASDGVIVRPGGFARRPGRPGAAVCLRWRHCPERRRARRLAPR